MIKSKIDKYIGFDSDLIFKNEKIDLIRLFGGALRDIIAEQKINDLDILVGPRSYKYVREIIEDNGFKYVDEISNKDLVAMYKDIKIITEPHSFIKIIDNEIRMIQLIKPGTKDVSIESLINVVFNVDLSPCGISYDGVDLYENIPDAIEDSLNMVYRVLENTSMATRTTQRINKLEDRGWVSLSNKESKRRINLGKLLNDVKYIKEYGGLSNTIKNLIEEQKRKEKYVNSLY